MMLYNGKQGHNGSLILCRNPSGLHPQGNKGGLFTLQGTLMLPFDLTVLLIVPSIKGELYDRGGYLVWLWAIWSASYWFHMCLFSIGEDSRVKRKHFWSIQVNQAENLVLRLLLILLSTLELILISNTWAVSFSSFFSHTILGKWGVVPVKPVHPGTAPSPNAKEKEQQTKTNLNLHT